MRSAKTILELIRERGKRGLPLERVYKLLFNKDLYLMAYGKIYRNKGAMTHGVTDETPDSMSLAKIDAIIEALRYERYRWLPARRTYIPKKNGKKRPLGMPVWSDKLVQEVIRLILEAYYEPQFSDHSYGFRSERGCHTALGEIYKLWTGTTWFIEEDISQCFDKLRHELLVNTLSEHIHDGRFLNLKRELFDAGYMEEWTFNQTLSGVPQGGIVSPLLANIALHGIEEVAANVCRKKREQPVLIRYADDFLIFHPSKDILDKAIDAVTTWLKDRGLLLSPQKTRVTHTLTPYQGNVGFDFLGFTVRQFQVGKTNTGKDTQGKPLSFKTIIRPSETAIKRHTRDIKKRIRKLRGAPQEKLIKDLNPVIRGWANYYRTVVSSKVYHACDNIVYYQLVQWTKWRHPDKSGAWRSKKYWRQIGNQKWVFAASETMTIRKHGMTHILSPYAKVRGKASPYDGNLLYWSQRLKNHPLLRGKLAKLLQKQQGKCRWCELTFREGDVIEIDHNDGNHANDDPSNLFALHRHCHDERHAKPREAWKYAAGINHT